MPAESVQLTLPLPYDLTEDQLVLDRSSLVTGPTVGDTIMWIVDNLGLDNADEELERIFRSAIILFHREAGTFAQCLDTALTWEVG